MAEGKETVYYCLPLLVAHVQVDTNHYSVQMVHMPREFWPFDAQTDSMWTRHSKVCPK